MSELIDALNQLQKEKHIEKEVIMQAIEDSLVVACNRDFGKNAVVKFFGVTSIFTTSPSS